MNANKLALVAMGLIVAAIVTLIITNPDNNPPVTPTNGESGILYHLNVDLEDGSTINLDSRLTEQECRDKLAALEPVLLRTTNSAVCEGWKDGQWKALVYANYNH